MLLNYVNMQELLCARYGRSAHEDNTADGRMRSETVNAQWDCSITSCVKQLTDLQHHLRCNSGKEYSVAVEVASSAMFMTFTGRIGCCPVALCDLEVMPSAKLQQQIEGASRNALCTLWVEHKHFGTH